MSMLTNKGLIKDGRFMVELTEKEMAETPKIDPKKYFEEWVKMTIQHNTAKNQERHN